MTSRTKSENQDLKDLTEIADNLTDGMISSTEDVDITLWNSDDIAKWPLDEIIRLKEKSGVNFGRAKKKA